MPHFKSEYKKKVRNFIENERRTDYLDFLTMFSVRLDLKKTMVEQ